MSFIKDQKKDILSTIDSIMVAIKDYPTLEDFNVDLSFNMNGNAIELLIDILKRTKGYEFIIDMLSNLIVAIVPIAEATIKTILVTQLKMLLNECSVLPRISEKMLTDGFIFSLKDLDLMNILQYCPISSKKSGKVDYSSLYYFGCDSKHGITCTDDLIHATDFNAFLWYVKNKAIGRVVWGETTDNPSYEDVVCKKSDGIITLEYSFDNGFQKSGSFNGPTNIPGTTMSPNVINDCIHVMIGNTRCCYSGDYNNTKTAIININKKLNEFDDLNHDVTIAIKELEPLKSLYEDLNVDIEAGNRPNSTLGVSEQIEQIINDLYLIKDVIEKKNSTISTIQSLKNDGSNYYVDLKYASIKTSDGRLTQKIKIPNEIYSVSVDSLVSSKKVKLDTLDNLENSPNTKTYRDLKNNYYYAKEVNGVHVGKSLFKFNFDYVNSLKFFDKKTLTVQLLDTITHCLTSRISFSGNFQLQWVRNQVEQMVMDIINTDDTVVSDCFFAFSNDRYNDMMEQTELNRMNQYAPQNGQYEGTSAPNFDEILESLNGLSDDATRDESISMIKGALLKTAHILYPDSPPEDELQANVNGQFNLIEQTLDGLVMAIVQAILSPKVYLLLAINLQIVNDVNDFNIEKFIARFREMIKDIIRQLRDQIIKLIMDKVTEILNQIILTFAQLQIKEQYDYYVRLLKQCLECFGLFGSMSIGIPIPWRKKEEWTMPNVQHADIIQENNEPVIAEC